MLFNKKITLEDNSMKFCLVTFIFLKLFSEVILLLTWEFDENQSIIKRVTTIYVFSP